MIESEFALEFALLARGAILIQTVQSEAKPVTIRLFSKDHQTVFWAMVDNAYSEDNVGQKFWISIHAGVESSVSLQERFVLAGDNLLRELALTVESAEEELIARKHREKLIDLLAKKAPDPGELKAYCAKAGIAPSGSGLTVEECGLISAWLGTAKMRQEASRAAPSGHTWDLGTDLF